MARRTGGHPGTRSGHSIMEILRGEMPCSGDTTALIDLRGGTTTYRWLHNRAALLAAELQRHASGPGAVGVLCERSAVQVAGMLATWRAGLIYCPLDPSLPPQRLLVRRELQHRRAPVLEGSLVCGLEAIPL